MVATLKTKFTWKHINLKLISDQRGLFASKTCIILPLPVLYKTKVQVNRR